MRAKGDLNKAAGLERNKAKVIEGRLNVFYTDRCLCSSRTPTRPSTRQDHRRTGRGRRHEGFRFVHWELPKE